MALTNQQVAERFAEGREGAGGNMQARIESNYGVMTMVGYSYRTPVAAYALANSKVLWLSSRRYSNSTSEHIRRYRREWGAQNLGSDAQVMEVGNVLEQGSEHNVMGYVVEAKEQLLQITSPARLQMKTRIAAWNQYNRLLEYAEVLSQFTSPVTSRERMALVMSTVFAQVAVARGANPTGLPAEFNKDMLLRVKALAALEGL